MLAELTFVVNEVRKLHACQYISDAHDSARAWDGWIRSVTDL
jgi:hypothetical protein